MRDRKTQAADLLVHYFKTAFEKAGARWDEDNETEVRIIVDLLWRDDEKEKGS